MVLTETNGHGVDLVLNSLTGDKLRASARCVAKHGRFLEIGKYDLISNQALGMDLFLKDVLESVLSAFCPTFVSVKSLHLQVSKNDGVTYVISI